MIITCTSKCHTVTWCPATSKRSRDHLETAIRLRPRLCKSTRQGCPPMAESQDLQWMEFESPWPCQPGKVRVFEPDESARREALSSRAWRNERARPYIFETRFERRMHFTNDATQSAMLLADPDALIAQYMRKMMAFLL